MPINVLAVRIDQVWIALLAESVQEVIGERAWVAIVGAPAELPGAVAWRGRAIALLDLGQLIAGGKPLGAGEGR